MRVRVTLSSRCSCIVVLLLAFELRAYRRKFTKPPRCSYFMGKCRATRHILWVLRSEELIVSLPKVSLENISGGMQ